MFIQYKKTVQLFSVFKPLIAWLRFIRLLLNTAFIAVIVLIYRSHRGLTINVS